MNSLVISLLCLNIKCYRTPTQWPLPYMVCTPWVGRSINMVGNGYPPYDLQPAQRVQNPDMTRRPTIPQRAWSEDRKNPRACAAQSACGRRISVDIIFVRDCDDEIKKGDQYCASAKSCFDRIYMLMLPIVPRLRNIGANFVDRLSQPLH